MVQLSILILCMLVGGGCASSQVVSDTAETDTTMAKEIKVEAQQRFGSSFDIAYNTDSTFALVQVANRAGRPTSQATVRFFLYDTGQGEVIFEDTIARGTVAWHDGYRIEVIKIPGIIRGDEQGDRRQGYLYDVQSHQKHPRPSK